MGNQHLCELGIEGKSFRSEGLQSLQMCANGVYVAPGNGAGGRRFRTEGRRVLQGGTSKGEKRLKGRFLVDAHGLPEGGGGAEKGHERTAAHYRRGVVKGAMFRRDFDGYCT